MPLSPEHAGNIDRFFTAVKSLNQLDAMEIRNVVGGVLNPTVRESYFTLNYHRAAINIELVLTLLNTKQFQAIVMLARSVLETAVEMKLLAVIPRAVEKATLFAELEKMRAARKIVAFKHAHPEIKNEMKPYEEFLQVNEQRLMQEKSRMWPTAKRVTHWSLMNMEERAKSLGREFDELYQLHYSQFSWYVHSGITGIANLKGETFSNLCGVAFRLTMECYAHILESIINEFKIYKADPRLKDKITFAKMLPFTNSQREIDALRHVLLGE